MNVLLLVEWVLVGPVDLVDQQQGAGKLKRESI